MNEPLVTSPDLTVKSLLLYRQFLDDDSQLHLLGMCVNDLCRFAYLVQGA